MRKNGLNLLGAVLALFFFSMAWVAEARENKEISKNYRQSAKKYRFTIDEKTKLPGHMSGILLPINVIEKELDRFFVALDDLGVSFVRKSGLKRVAICRDLTVNGKGVGGVAIGDCIYLNYGFSKKTVYHEMFHVFDPKRDNKAWIRLNHKDFLYRGAKSSSQELSERKQRDVQKHYAQVRLNFDADFVSMYAQTNEVEDRAETFAYMIAEGPRFLQRVRKSSVLYNKMLLIIEMTSRSSLLGKDFWRLKFGSQLVLK